ncbi:Hypothetical protein MVR_LOCUS218 [uncultured virus]|nr:Hypothetical protein MVR_LOCUS218 [uncultured virus]
MDKTKSDDFRSASSEKITSRERYILERNRAFFSVDRKYLDIMLDIVTGSSRISIRALDWFVANYSKKMNTRYRIKVNEVESDFNVNIEYKNQLNSYSKQYFDPFCRKKKVVYSYKQKDGTEPIAFVTSIGQLNFFQWAIRNKVIRYVGNHLEEIEKDQKDTTRRNKEDKRTSSQSSDEDEDSDSDRDRDRSRSRPRRIDLTDDEPNDDPDPVICSSTTINSIHISPQHRTSSLKSDSSTRNRRQQLSKSVFERGIKKSNIPIVLSFD